MIDLRLGDCLEILQTLEDNSVDSVVCDPPYHLTSTKGGNKGFMGKEWDGGDIAFRTDVWKECLRVLKPGGHLLAFSSSRTYHRIAVAIEDAGFDIRDQIMWIYGQGFPKSHNIGKKVEGYEGWGTALKPAHEPIVMARKPISEKSVAENVLKWRTGGINIDGSRIDFRDEADKESAKPGSLNATGEHSMFGLKSGNELNDGGRFPANVMFDEEAGKLLDEQTGILKSGYVASHHKTKDSSWYGASGQYSNNSTQRYDLVGGASRFFYCPKASKKEKNLGLEGLPEKQNIHRATHNGTGEASKGMERFATQPKMNHHPTIKPIALMEYLIKLITREGGVVLDCFMGSGSTGVAAVRNGYSFIGVEKEQEYFDIAKQRIDYEA